MGPNVGIQRAPQAIRWNEMMGTAHELAANDRPPAHPRKRPRERQQTGPEGACQRKLHRHRPKRRHAPRWRRSQRPKSQAK